MGMGRGQRLLGRRERRGVRRCGVMVRCRVGRGHRGLVGADRWWLLIDRWEWGVDDLTD